ncbi:hypothetical protein LCGC14_2528310 [marine sediment metagenome]|uniref:Uncharacterized protein n=1 Tax=marine sediment metagenome TaxID=412755 RepID=A0A0F9DMI1_9ZZZZ
MKVKKERAQLVTALGDIKPAIPRKGDDDMIRKVIFTGHDIAGYGEDMIMVVPYETDFATVAPSEEIAQMLQRVTATQFTLSFNAQNQIVMEAVKEADPEKNTRKTTMKTVLKTNPDSHLIEELTTGLLAEIATAEWYELSEDDCFGEAIKRCMYSASKDGTQPELACVHIAGAIVASSDDYRVSRYVLPYEFAGDVLIKAETCIQMSRFVFTRYAITNTWVLFLTADNKLLASRLLFLEYGDLDQFLDFTGTDYPLPDKLAEHVEHVALMSAGDHDIEKEITVTLEAAKVTLKAEREVGFAEIEIEADLAITDPVSFTVNPTFFAAMLTGTDDVVNIGADKAVFEIGDYFKHLVSLTVV